MPHDNPFVGLRPFRSDEALVFFGRRQQTLDLLDRLHRSRFPAVVGSSGCGKSSLVLAGLLPQLEAGFLVENRDRWLVAQMTPGDVPLEQLAADFAMNASELRECGAHSIIERLECQPDNAEKNCLILVDQFEELFRFSLSRCCWRLWNSASSRCLWLSPCVRTFWAIAISSVACRKP